MCSSPRLVAYSIWHNKKHVDLSTVSVLVLDEADRLLDMGFVRDVRRIVAQTPATRQTLLFSATMPSEVAKLSREILKSPTRVDVSPKQITVKDIHQQFVNVENAHKTERAGATAARFDGLARNRLYPNQTRRRPRDAETELRRYWR